MAQAAFTDSRLTDNTNHITLALQGSLKRGLENGHFIAAANET